MPVAWGKTVVWGKTKSDQSYVKKERKQITGLTKDEERLSYLDWKKNRSAISRTPLAGNEKDSYLEWRNRLVKDNNPRNMSEQQLRSRSIKFVSEDGRTIVHEKIIAPTVNQPPKRTYLIKAKYTHLFNIYRDRDQQQFWQLEKLVPYYVNKRENELKDRISKREATEIFNKIIAVNNLPNKGFETINGAFALLTAGKLKLPLEYIDTRGKPNISTDWIRQ